MSANSTDKDTRTGAKVQPARADVVGPPLCHVTWRLAALAVLSAVIPVLAYLVSGLLAMLVSPPFSEH